MQRKECSACRTMKSQTEFSDWQWRKEEGRRCTVCGPESETKQCCQCLHMKAKIDFSDWQWRKTGDRRCKACNVEDKRRCASCHNLKGKQEYHWRHWGEEDRKCKECAGRQTRGPKGTWKCGGCHESKPHSAFTQCAKNSRGTKKGRCAACVRRIAVEAQAQWKHTQEHVVKRQRRT